MEVILLSKPNPKYSYIKQDGGYIYAIKTPVGYAYIYRNGLNKSLHFTKDGHKAPREWMEEHFAILTEDCK